MLLKRLLKAQMVLHVFGHLTFLSVSNQYCFLNPLLQLSELCFVGVVQQCFRQLLDLQF